MSLARPNKKRIKQILIILANRVIALFDASPPVEGSASEAAFDNLTAGKAVLYQFPGDAGGYSEAQAEAWGAVENLETAIGPNAVTQATEEDIAALDQDLADKLARC